MTVHDDFPRAHARTRRFTLGRPRALRVAADGGRVLFLRSASGTDPVTDLWCLDIATREETKLVTAADLLGADGGEDLPRAERARRERAREMSSGIVAYGADRDLGVVAFALAGRLFTLQTASASVTAHEQVAAGVFDPRPSPDGGRVAWVGASGLEVLDLGGDGAAGPATPRLLAGEDAAEVSWGAAEFIAAEEMGRGRGFWWSPDGTSIAATRVDVSPVARWHIADPAAPDQPAVEHRYPAAGTANAEVRLFVLPVDDDGERVELDWDRAAFPYLAEVVWSGEAPLTLLVQARDQRSWQVLTADAATGATTVVRSDHDDDWLEIVPGAPAWAGERLVMVLDDLDATADATADASGEASGDGDGEEARAETGTRRLVVGAAAVTPPGLQVRALLDVSERGVWFLGSRDPLEQHVHHWDAATGEVVRRSTQQGVHGGAVGGDVAVVTSSTLYFDDTVTVVHARDGSPLTSLASFAERSGLLPDIEFFEVGPDRVRAALLRPGGDRGEGPLPVLLDPYGGPHAQRVLKARAPFQVSQWFADQGFAVLVVDGRGTPRGPVFERAVRGDLATGVLQDQVDALAAAVEIEPRIDLGRVGIRGWSFGGYLAALAVLRRPDVFHAAIAGAPVTDWRLYDTHYTERYLGHPDQDPEAYRVSSLVDADRVLIDAAPLAAGQAPPALMLIHGLADDNVVAAHALRLSHALLAAGRPHEFLPLTGVTHMTPQESVAENLLRLQLDFLIRTLRPG